MLCGRVTNLKVRQSKRTNRALTEYNEEGRITIQERYEDGELVEKVK